MRYKVRRRELRLSNKHHLLIEESFVDRSKPWVLLLNGSLFNQYQWDLLRIFLLKQAGGDINYIRYDYGGSGLSWKSECVWSMDDLTLELAALLDILKLDQVHLYGMSKGTAIAQWFMLHHKARALSLGGYGWFHFGYSQIDSVKDFFARRLKYFEDFKYLPDTPLTFQEFEAVWERVYATVLAQSRASIPRWLQKLLSIPIRRKAFKLLAPTPLPRMYQWFSYVVSMMEEGKAQFPQIRQNLIGTPLLIQHAQRDGTLPFAMAQELADCVPNAKLIGYPPGFNHVSIALNPVQAKQVVADYTKFLKSLSRLP